MRRSFLFAACLTMLACPSLRAQEAQGAKNPKVQKAFSELNAFFGVKPSPGAVAAGHAAARPLARRAARTALAVKPGLSEKTLNVPLLGAGAVSGAGASGALSNLAGSIRSKVSGLGDKLRNKWVNGNIQDRMDVIAGGAVLVGGGFVVAAVAAPAAAGTAAVGAVTCFAGAAALHYGAPIFQSIQDKLHSAFGN